MSEKTLEELVKSLNILAAQGMELLNGKQVPPPAEPVIENNTVVGAWNGIRPEQLAIGYYHGRGRLLNRLHYVRLPILGIQCFEHVEPYRAPIRWDRIRRFDNVLVFDSGAVVPWLAENYMVVGSTDTDWGTVIAIEHRPGTNGGKDE